MLKRICAEKPYCRTIQRSMLLLLAVVVIIGAVRYRPEPLTIGFLGELTGRGSVFSLAGRNGTILAIEQANAAGGVLGREVRLAVANYQDGSDDVLKAFEQLMEADVEAVVGPMTSAAAVKLMRSEIPDDIVLFSPTSETSWLAGISDQFFRIAPASSVSVKMLAEHMLTERGVRKVAIVLDTDNGAFTRDWQEEFGREYTSRGGAVVEIFSYSSKGLPRFNQLAHRVAASGAEGVLLLTHAADTALFSQQVAKDKLPIACFCTSWASSPVLVRMGGRSVEGLTWVQGSNYDDQTPAYREFKRSYRARFNTLPDYSALHAYEATSMLLRALAGEEKLPLAKRLHDLNAFISPQDTLVMTPEGDVIRDLHLLSIREGEITSLAHSREPFTALLNP